MKCTTCHGTGGLMGFTGLQRHKLPCPDCRGTGSSLVGDELNIIVDCLLTPTPTIQSKAVATASSAAEVTKATGKKVKERLNEAWNNRHLPGWLSRNKDNDGNSSTDTTQAE